MSKKHPPKKNTDQKQKTENNLVRAYLVIVGVILIVFFFIQPPVNRYVLKKISPSLYFGEERARKENISVRKIERREIFFSNGRVVRTTDIPRRSSIMSLVNFCFMGPLFGMLAFVCWKLNKTGSSK